MKVLPKVPSRRFQLVEQGQKPNRHKHYKPGPFRRWLRRLHKGSIIQCRCGTYFRLGTPNYTYNPSWITVQKWEYPTYGIETKST